MGLMYLLAAVVAAVAVSNADEMVMLANTTYADVMLNGETQISKNMNVSQDKNVINFSPKNIMNMNESYTFMDTDISAMNFTLGAATDESDGLASKRVTGTMTVNSGTLNLWVDIFTVGGNITMDGETTVVMAGDLRITLSIADYSWDDASTMLSFKFYIKGSDDNPSMVSDDAKTDGKTYKLGNGGMVRLSEKGMVGSDYVAMMPMVNDKMVTVSFNKSDTATVYTYQFFIAPATADLDTSASTRVTSLSVLALLLTSLAIWLS